MLLVLLLLSDWGQSFEALRQASAQIESMEARIVQRKSLKILARPLVSEGRIAYQKPDLLRIEYDRPLWSLLLMRHGQIRRYIRQAGRRVPDAALRVEAMRAVGEEIQSWLQGRFEDKGAFRATLEPGAPTRVILLPRTASLQAILHRIVLTLDVRPGVLRSILIEEGEGNQTLLEFEEVRLNAPVDAGAFDEPQ